MIIPAIIPKSEAHLLASLEAVAGAAKSVQIDVVDGVSVPGAEASWPYNVPTSERLAVEGVDNEEGENDAAGGAEASLPPLLPAHLAAALADFRFEVDLMVADPVAAAKQWLTLGADRLVVHLEGLEKEVVEELISMKDEWGFFLGFSVLNSTPLSELEAVIDHADFVQLMGIAEIGVQGNPFDETVLERVETLRTTYPTLPISIDGSMNATTIPKVKTAGANRFVVGSAVYGAEDQTEAYEELTQLIS